MIQQVKALRGSGGWDQVHKSPLSGLQLQPLRPLSLPVSSQYLPSHQPRITPTTPLFLCSQGFPSSSIQFLPHWGFKQVLPQEPTQHFLVPLHSLSLIQALGGFIMAHLIRIRGQEPGFV